MLSWVYKVDLKEIIIICVLECSFYSNLGFEMYYIYNMI